jgi:regulator of cell morphogenesis and NO signaling
MFSSLKGIKPESFVGEIVSDDYRTADVFKKFGIEYCCGAEKTLQQACDALGIETTKVQEELNYVTRTMQIPTSLNFTEWPADFLVDYIQKLHHNYLRQTLPGLICGLEHFVKGHAEKYPTIVNVASTFNAIARLVEEHIEYQEGTIFPYVRQINSALKNGADYGSLLVRMLRKPVNKTFFHEYENLRKLLHELRMYTNNYAVPGENCLSHKVIMQKLQEVDNDLVQHIYLENTVLLPKVAEIEKELLERI